jgi:uncharacterized iron-regulated protein
MPIAAFAFQVAIVGSLSAGFQSKQLPNSAMQAQNPDPYLLPIGKPGTVVVSPGTLVETRTGKVVTVAQVAQAAKGKRFFYLGENHATAPHQQMHADIVAALLQANLKPTIGVEFFWRTKQDILDQWTAGKLTEDEFLTQSEYKSQWGYDYKFYRPLFQVAKEQALPVVGLNVPRDWVRTSARNGHAALPTTAKMQLPPKMRMDNKQHRTVFEALIGGHPMSETAMNNMYSAQVLWDEGMADSALKYMAVNPPTKRDIFVIAAGSGHVMYGQGINYRIEQRKGGSGLTLVMIQSESAATVSRGIADFVYCTKPEPKQ